MADKVAPAGDARPSSSDSGTHLALHDMNGVQTSQNEEGALDISTADMPSSTRNLSPLGVNGAYTENRPISPTPLHGGGATGKAIERLTSANERLNRELSAQRAANFELKENLRTKAKVVETVSAANLQLQADIEKHENLRTKRKAVEEDLNARLDAETERRKHAEEREAAMSHQLGAIRSKTSEDVAMAKQTASQEIAKAHQEVAKARAEVAAAIARAERMENQDAAFRTMVERIKEEQKRRNKKLENHWLQHHERQAHDREHLEAIDVTQEQQRTQLERLTATNRKQTIIIDQLTRQVAESEAAREKEAAKMRQTVEETEQRHAKLEQEMVDTINKMRWVMRLQQNKE
ncbi:hypothetical protein K490DRAFT_58575 [Saccharata proteae CBS 121410]|uniref:Uncharacterized protein n=1 Tax=Saccharata proteae CBS 121410 TaxID=1314787 RepID=A0A9P4HSL5_9PEZI|nr:hypothetical protein K490DRAFT_58575 [Saccharata proteae CBS 121410]